MNDLAGLKRLLVLEGDLHRRLIGLERENLRKRFAGLRAAQERVTSNKPLLIAGSAVTGWLVLRHWRRVARWIPAVITVRRWMRGLN